VVITQEKMLEASETLWSCSDKVEEGMVADKGGYSSEEDDRSSGIISALYKQGQMK
jgi:hypothetical protein